MFILYSPKIDYEISMMKKVFLFIVIAVFLSADSVIAAECARVGKEIANQKKAVLVRSTPVVQDGREMCVVVVVVPARDGKKLHRVEVSIPAD
ncbi:hypothetical protein BQ03900 [Bartonella quintana str. Toulouse]|uniref:Uncharacterized protein n=3 Tax=Bartonella quintana TaxID=803 RepID=A0A0H3LTQ0_BARQU|nr:hypothetical protein BQ03900 [Bartonella quintana str. Toulouse]